MSADGTLSLETLIVIFILLLYTISSSLFEKYHFHYLHESGMCMIIGISITVIAKLVYPVSNFTEHLKFDDEMFFTFILPPIIFAAGYNLRRRSFFKYFLYIFLFGVLGTVITFLVVLPLTYFANSNQLFRVTTSNIDMSEHNSTISRHLSQNNNNSENYNEIVLDIPETPSYILDFSMNEILLFSSVISATDTVAALTFIKEEQEPKLFAILFGEGVINDAVCIVLYGILREFTSSNEQFTSQTPIIMIGSFLNMFFFSFLVGSLVGIASSIFLKELKFIKMNRVQECSVIVFFAFISYTLTEELGLSPIIALLFTGIFMAHYSFYNLSFQAREESAIVSKIMSNIAEGFVFTYLGLTVIYYISHSFSFTFFFFELIFVITGRVIAIYGTSFIMDYFKIHSFNIKSSQKGIMSCAGSIRGAIAVGLAISIDTKNKLHKEVLISSTLGLVFFTTIVFGALMPFVIKFLKKYEESNEHNEGNYIELSSLNNNISEVKFDYQHPNFSPDLVSPSKEKDLNKLKERLSYWMGTYWVEFDNLYMKPKLVHNWPHVKEQHDQISIIIKKEIDEYKQHKKIKDNQESKEHNINMISIETPEKKVISEERMTPTLTLFPTKSNKAASKWITP